MIIKDGMIAECTRIELYGYWLRYFSDMYSFPDYMQKVRDLGTIVHETKDGD